MLLPSFLLGFLFDTEDGGKKFIRIVGVISQMIVLFKETIYLFSY
jgi:hypothetical protein